MNPERLARTFMALVEIDSVSKSEGQLCGVLRNLLESLGAETDVDDCAAAVGSDTGNLVAVVKGDMSVPALFFNAHMDTVEPGKGIKPLLKNGTFTSGGDTILGADDKSAIAILLEVLQVLKEGNISHGPIELVFTVCEEIGLLGAKHLEVNRLSARYGYALDASDPDGIVVRAPSANRLTVTLFGKDAHAGAAPEEGINAIVMASRAIAGLDIGRIDHETTCNIGVIEGGRATNIVPDRVIVKGEVRSHDDQKLARKTAEMISAFERVVADFKTADRNRMPRLEYRVQQDFPRTNVPEEHPVIQLAVTAAKNLGRQLTLKASGGGADANIFFSKGIMTPVLGTGMRNMHTTGEAIELADMVRCGELVLEIIRSHTARHSTVTP